VLAEMGPAAAAVGDDEAMDDRHDAAKDAAGQVRYGVFLRPDPRTCAAVTAITSQLRAQYGLVSAAAFPPHATLAGSLPLDGDPRSALHRLVDAVDGALFGMQSFRVVNAGIAWLGAGLVYDIHDIPTVDESDGARKISKPNYPLVEPFSRIDTSVRPLLAPVPDGQLAADVHECDAWRAHLGLATHDLFERDNLRDEVRDYAEALAVLVPSEFMADTVALYRFMHPSWTGRWWIDLQWEYVRSWHLRPSPLHRCPADDETDHLVD
jgi:hypothetical protein